MNLLCGVTFHWKITNCQLFSGKEKRKTAYLIGKMEQDF